MSRPRYPTFCRKGSRDWFYCWDTVARKKVYLGTDLDTARARYEELVRLDADTRQAEPDDAAAVILSVNELLLRYVKSPAVARMDFRRVRRIKAAARFAKVRHGETPADSFRVVALEEVRERMLVARDRRHTKNVGEAKPLARSYVNTLIAELKAAWTWAAKRDLVSKETAGTHAFVTALLEGDGGTEPPDVPAVELWAVEATLPFLSPVVADMVRLQVLSGMRPGELCVLTASRISRDPKSTLRIPGTKRDVSAIACGETVVWVAVPLSHKTKKKGKPRAVLLGPLCQAILTPLLERPGDAPFFSARESSDWHARKLGRSPNRGRRAPRDHFDTHAYGQAVERAVESANRSRAEQGLPPIPHWMPNQLRHRAGSDVSERFDRPTAAAFLGHAGVDVIDVYVEQEMQKAAKAAAAMG